jgi:uncharacterized protein (DUF433 family)
MGNRVGGLTGGDAVENSEPRIYRLLVPALRSLIHCLSGWRSTAYNARVDYREIITIELGKRGGKPCIRGMRITVYDVLSYLASGMTHQEILADFPYLSRGRTFSPASATLLTASTTSW